MKNTPLTPGNFFSKGPGFQVESLVLQILGNLRERKKISPSLPTILNVALTALGQHQHMRAMDQNGLKSLSQKDLDWFELIAYIEILTDLHYRFQPFSDSESDLLMNLEAQLGKNTPVLIQLEEADSGQEFWVLGVGAQMVVNGNENFLQRLLCLDLGIDLPNCLAPWNFELDLSQVEEEGSFLAIPINQRVILKQAIALEKP